MLILGLTGGIATGKTSASEYFRSQGIPVVDADQLARFVVEPGKPAYYQILRHFGPLNILERNNRSIDRKRLGELIFGNEQMRKQLNKCTHSYIRREAMKELIRYFYQFQPIVIWDVPLLFEVGLNRILSNTLVIACDQTTQLERLKERDDIADDQQALQRINAQMDLNGKCRRARFVIDNSGSKDILHKQLKEFLLTIQPSQFQTMTWYVLLFIPVSLTYGFLRLWDYVDHMIYRNRS